MMDKAKAIINVLSKYRIIEEQKNGGWWAEIKPEYVADEIQALTEQLGENVTKQSKVTNSQEPAPPEDGWVLVHEDEIDGTELRMYAKKPIEPATLVVRMQKTGENFTEIKSFTDFERNLMSEPRGGEPAPQEEE